MEQKIQQESGGKQSEQFVENQELIWARKNSETANGKKTHCVHTVCSAFHLLLASYLFGILLDPVHSTETLVNFY